MTRRISTRAMLALVALLAAGTLAFMATRGLGNSVVYYYTPSELVARRPGSEVVRVAGTVVAGTVRFDRAAGMLRFKLAERGATVTVANRGAPPGLFAAGRQALVEGRYEDGILRSSDVIVKHDEEYRAPEAQR